MRFAPQFLDEVKARLPVSQVVGRKVVLKKKGHEFWGLSPFKTEKTPSFSVNDIKGFYHCFATQEHGDIFTFLIKTEGISFSEAVERLASEAGVQLPDEMKVLPSERGDERKRLLELMAVATKFFKQQLFTETGRVARDYIANRQINDDIVSCHEIGYAPNNSNSLKDHLRSAGFSEHDMILSGMLINGSNVRRPYDRFRNRVIFPIHDLKGQVVAFGGRALSSEAPAKYLNSPETPLFHKGHILYNSHRARKSAFRTGELIVVEGYMDVIALARANMVHSVAPLGTALTTEQLQMMWRMAPEPIMCFDGDQAGQKAAHRALDIALPLLKPGLSLRFVFIDNGLDPDDVIARHGASAMRALLGQAKSFEEVLWQREWKADIWSTPERRAALDTRLNTLIDRISNTSVKSHYRWAIKQRLRDAWRPSFLTKSYEKIFVRKDHAPQRLSFRQKCNYHNNTFTLPERAESLRDNSLVTGPGQNHNREASLIRALINHPWLISDFAETIARLEFFAPRHQRLCDNLLALLIEEAELDTQTISNHLKSMHLEKDLESVMHGVHHNCDRFAEADAEENVVTKGWCAELAAHKLRMLRNQIEIAEKEHQTTNNEKAYLKLMELKKIEAAFRLEMNSFGD